MNLTDVDLLILFYFLVDVFSPEGHFEALLSFFLKTGSEDFIQSKTEIGKGRHNSAWQFFNFAPLT